MSVAPPFWKSGLNFLACLKLGCRPVIRVQPIRFTSDRPVTNEGRAMEAGARCPRDSTPDSRSSLARSSQWHPWLFCVHCGSLATSQRVCPHFNVLFQILVLYLSIGSSGVWHKEPRRDVTFKRKLLFSHGKFSWDDQEMERKMLQDPCAQHRQLCGWNYLKKKKSTCYMATAHATPT